MDAFKYSSFLALFLNFAIYTTTAATISTFSPSASVNFTRGKTALRNTASVEIALESSVSRCDFESRDDLLKQVERDWKGRNVSELVHECPSACKLIFGTGNPDISGNGAVASYIIQFLLTAIFGPILHIMLLFEHRFTDRTKRLYKLLRSRGNRSVAAGSSFTALALTIATCVRKSQVPSVFEQDFMFLLIYLQFLILMANLLPTIMFYCLDEENEAEAWWWLPSMMLTLSVLFGLYPLLMLNAGCRSEDDCNALRHISKFCTYENDLPLPNYEPLHDSSSIHLNLTWWQLLLAIVGVTMVVVPLEIVILAFDDAGYPEFLYRHIVRGISRAIPHGHWRHMIVRALCWGSWAALCIFLFVKMEQERHVLAHALGSSYQDTLWGFGQVVAIVLWMPIFYIILGEIPYEFYTNKYEKVGTESAESDIHRQDGSNDADGEINDSLELSSIREEANHESRDAEV